MRILFIYPNLYAQIGFNYGVAFLSAVLRERGHETALINVNDALGYPLDLERIWRDVRAFGPDMIAFSIVTNQYRYAVEIAGFLRERTSVPMIVGGVHVTMDPEGVFSDGLFDYACVGEGEEAFAELVDRLAAGQPTDSVRNIWTRKNGKVIGNPVRPFPNLAALPMKDYEIFDFQHMIDAKNGWVGVMASRGCPFRCTYCFNHKVVELYQRETGLKGRQLKYVRHHPVEDVIAELKILLDRYERIAMFIFDDDLFTSDRAYVLEFCRRYQQEIDVPFVCNAHPTVFDDALAQALKSAGCALVKYGVESGSERVRREVMHRYMSNDQIAEAFETAHKAGLDTSAFVMFGLPHETIEDIGMTLDLLARVGPTRMRWAIFFPYVNTEAYRISEEDGFINFDKMHKLSSFMYESCLDFGPEHNLFIRKLQKTFPWHVNARLGGTCGELYAHLVDAVDRLDDAEFAPMADQMRGFDGSLSRVVTAAGIMHYGIKYNDFMAVKAP
jgi:anaerobic magnesium-protoporphyrin IX monomethyl ester cyclase